jgi:hypothetical protein
MHVDSVVHADLLKARAALDSFVWNLVHGRRKASLVNVAHAVLSCTGSQHVTSFFILAVAYDAASRISCRSRWWCHVFQLLLLFIVHIHGGVVLCRRLAHIRRTMPHSYDFVGLCFSYDELRLNYDSSYVDLC